MGASSRLIVVVGVLMMASTAAAAERRFALVIGNNGTAGSEDPELSELSFADDDALRYGELFRQITERVDVLTVPDADTAQLFPDVVPRPATRGAVLAALHDIRGDMERARRDGDRPILFFVYSGHGNYDGEGRGYVHLADGRFTTRDLFRHVLAPSGDDPVVLVIDACNAALLVNARGPGDRRPARPTHMNLESYPNVGVVLSSSSVGETHEWGRYLAGVFSHEVRSGLVGPADVDGDGRITFPELAAFVAAANAKVKNPQIRVHAYVRPPLSDPSLALVDLASARFASRLELGDDFAGKAWVLDEDLVRYADFHKEAGEDTWLGLAGGRSYVLVTDGAEYLIPAGARGDLPVTALARRSRTVLSARGSHSAYFDRTLFREPYGKDFAEGYLAKSYVDSLEVARLVPDPWYENAPAWATLGGGVAALVAGGVVYGMAVGARNASAASPWADERERLNQQMTNRETAATALFATGGAAAVSGILWLALDRSFHREHYRPPLHVNLGPNGVSISTDL